MGQTFFFEIPGEHFGIMKHLIESIPDDWEWVDGRLHATKETVNVAFGMEFRISRSNDSRPVLVMTGDSLLDYDSVIIEGRHPEFFSFEEVPYQSRRGYTMKSVKKTISSLLGLGYRGQLSFYKSDYRNSKFDNPARCNLIFQRWNGSPVLHPEQGEQPARIKIEWNEKFGGKVEDIEPIVSACHSIPLTEYDPRLKFLEQQM